MLFLVSTRVLLSFLTLESPDLTFELFLLQMTGSDLVVRLTRCEGVRGFPALFAAALASQGCRWYPEYTVYEEYVPYSQAQFFCKVRVLNDEGRVENVAGGVGMTVEQAVQEAAYNGLSIYRSYCPYLANQASDFCHFPAADDSTSGVYRAVYSSGEMESDSRHRALIELVRALDRRARQWYLYAVSARASHRATLMSVRPYVMDGTLPPTLLRSLPLEELPPDVRSPGVGGVTPPTGPHRDPRLTALESPYGNQPASARRFHTPPAPLDEDVMAYY